MKHFRCGDVVPGCPATFTGTEGEVLAEVAGHAREVHDLHDAPDQTVAAVRAAMVDV